MTAENHFTQRLSRRGLALRAAEIVMGTSALSLLLKATPASAQNYNECTPLPQALPPIGTRTLSSCYNINGEYALALRPDLAEWLATAPTLPDTTLSVATDAFGYPDRMLKGFFQAIHKKDAPIDQAFCLQWMIGSRLPYGLFTTDWFSESELKSINLIQMEWYHRQMYQIQAYDENMQDQNLPQWFTPTRELVEPNPQNDNRNNPPSNIDPSFA